MQEIDAVVIGPAHRIENAMQLLDAQRPDAALLDVNIIGSTSAGVAKRLVQENIPFVLATGYGAQNGITGSWAVIDKPYNRKQVQAAFLRAVRSTIERAALQRSRIGLIAWQQQPTASFSLRRRVCHARPIG